MGAPSSTMGDGEKKAIAANQKLTSWGNDLAGFLSKASKGLSGAGNIMGISSSV